MSPRARHASAFVFALSVTMLVMVIGVAGIASLRAATAQGARTDDAVAVTQLARSAADLGVQMLVEYTTWRTGMKNDAWYELGDVNGAKLYMKIVDDDGSLSDDADDSFRVYGRAATDNATRMFSVLVRPSKKIGANMIANGDFETDLTGWTASDGNLAIETASPGEGLQSLRLENLTSGLKGPTVPVSGVAKKTVYESGFWARLASGSATLNVTLTLEQGLIDWSTYQSAGVIGTTWSHHTVTFAATDSSSFTGATLGFNPGGTTADFLLDGVDFHTPATTSLEVVEGTWRREID